MTNQEMKPGSYRLTRDVANPRPDKRVRRDWRKSVTWKAGTVFHVFTAHYGDAQVNEIHAGDWRSLSLMLREPQSEEDFRVAPQSLLEALEPIVALDLTTALRENNYTDFLEIGVENLIARGVISVDQVIRAIKLGLDAIPEGGE